MKLATALLLAIGVLFSNPAMSAPEDDVKALFERFVAAQNAHDANAVRDLLLDSPNFLWITRGTTIWGRDAAMKRFETLYQGTWRLAPDSSSLKIIMLGDNTAQLYASILYASIMFTIGAPGQPAQDGPTLMNQILVKTPSGWRVASILPIPLSPPAPAK